ncbi:hypothetical protein PVK06_001440 [Gossypium arboreum]|uniref:Uncharacterized protein n=1 Tax=Gossypium arboreum TaxID=29729 RepID=A0ABR0R227_GOSAR|nr:hypothetical protein PVK06_001440 [Gossypium arboreum]
MSSIVEILTTKAFHQMGLKDLQLKLTSPLYGFSNQPIEIKGSIVLLVVLGNGDHITTKMVEFLLVVHPSTSNVIFGRSIMRVMKLVVAMFCMVVKFPTPPGKGYIRFDQKMTRECHMSPYN